MNIINNINQEYITAIYIRLSKEDGDKEESESVANQRKILRAYAKDNKFTIYDEYVDDGYSGTNFDRPNFKRMIRDIENKRINMVITKSLSRLGRDYIETGRYIESYFPENGIRYVAILDDVDTLFDKNCDTVAFKNIMNDYYAKETSKNIKKTKNRKIKEGFYYTAYAPFGYKKIDKAGHLEIEQTQAEIVHKIYDLFLQGKGTFQIAKILNNEGIKSPGIQMKMTKVLNNIKYSTDKWNHNTVKRILTSPIYIGECVQNKRRKISYKSKKIIALPESEYSIIKNHHEPIINIEQWNLAQKMSKVRKNERVRDNDELFKGFLYCSHCNNKLTLFTKIDRYKEKKTTRKYIKCSTAWRYNANKTCIFRCSLNYQKFEQCVISKITEVLKEYLKNANAFNEKKVSEKLLQRNSNIIHFEEKINNLHKDLEKVNKKVNMLYNDRLNGILEEQDFKMFSENLISERKRIENLIVENKNEIDLYNNQSKENTIQEEIRNIIEDISKNQNYTKEILNILINRIEIDKDKNITIYFNFYELNYVGGSTDEQQVSNL